MIFLSFSRRVIEQYLQMWQERFLSNPYDYVLSINGGLSVLFYAA